MTTPKKFDVIVIGGGPGGYPAAIRAAQCGKSVALIEAKELGGTCLNRGCIPSKTLIANADILHRIQHASDFGINVSEVTFDYSKMIDRKDAVVSKMTKGIEGLLASNGITLFRGYGRFISPTEIKVTGKDNILLTAEKIIIATGSEPRNIAAFPCDHERILDSTDVLEMRTLPKKIAVVGGGIIGCEFASLYATFGVDVTILEMLPTIIPTESKSVSDVLAKAFEKQGIKIETGVIVQKIDRTEKGIIVQLASGKLVEADLAIVAVGRLLNTSDVGLDKAGVPVQDNGIIPVNSKMETPIAGIYAIGDIASKWWLAHVATHQGVIAAMNACGQTAHMHYNAIPSVIFTSPEVATVGMSLEQALEKGCQATAHAFPFQALGKAQATMQTEGFAQMIVDKKTGQILGAQVVGHDAANLIAEIAVAIANELTTASIADTIHAHPTIAEAWMEAALLTMDLPIHLPPKKAK